jgi:hypothetical protein
MELSRAPFAIRSGADDVTLRSMRVERFASPAQRGAVWVAGAGWTLDRLEVRQNHALGVYLSDAPRGRLLHSTVTDNGQLGVGIYRSDRVLVDDVDISRNNTDGFWIADWESGGLKVTYSRATTVRGCTVDDNLGVGLWADISNRAITFADNSITRNAADGVRFEISYSGSIVGNVLVENGFGLGRGGGTSLYSVAAININTSSDVTVEKNEVRDNANGIGLQMRDRGSGTSGRYDLHDVVVRDNEVTLRRGGAPGEGVSGLVVADGDPRYFDRKGNEFTANRYTLDSRTSARFAWEGTLLDVAGWQAAGQDRDGTFTAPS